MDALRGNSRSKRFGSSAILAFLAAIAFGGTSFAEAASSNSSGGAVDDYATTDKDAMVRIYAKNNDSGYDPNNVRLTVIQQPGHARSVYVGTAQNIEYRPARGFVGRDSLVYRLTDRSGFSSDAVVTVDVGCSPCESSGASMADSVADSTDESTQTAASSGGAVDDYATTGKDAMVRIYAKNNDSGYDPNNVRLTVIQQPGHARSVYVGTAQNIEYRPARGFVGRDSLVYRLTDRSGFSSDAVVTVDVGCSPCESSGASMADSVADPADESTQTAASSGGAVDDYATTGKDAMVRIYAKNNDSGYDPNNVRLTVIQQPGHARSVYVGTAQNIEYRPARGFVGRDSLVYRLTDRSGFSSDAVVTVDVGCSPCESSGGSMADSVADSTDPAPVTPPRAIPTTITLTWKGTSDKVDGYFVNYGPSVGSAILQIARISVTSGEVDPAAPYHVIYPSADLGLSAGDTACFRVQAYNAGGDSELSDAVCTAL